MRGRNLKQFAGMVVVVGVLAGWPAGLAHAQAKRGVEPALQIVTVPEPDAERTRNEFSMLLDHYPPTLRRVFRQDPTLLNQDQYLAPYPALVNFLHAHPEIALNPAYYLGGLSGNPDREDRSTRVFEMWDDFLKGIMVISGFALAAGLLTWLVRTFIDYRRWNRLSRVQAEVHTKILDRFSSNDEILAYIATPAGAKFLQSAPISLDTGTKSVGAPLNRILWSLQAGLVLAAAGAGMRYASNTIQNGEGEPLRVLGIVAIALGLGFALSAGVAFLLSLKLGLFSSTSLRRGQEPPEGSQ
jgi:hypothetical protein